MKNKKTLITSISITIALIIVIIIGNQYCDWAIFLLPLAFMPTIIWAIKNRKNISIKKNIIQNKEK